MIHTVQLRRFLPKEVYEAVRIDKKYEFRYQKGKGYFTTKYIDLGLNEVKMTKYSNGVVTYYYMDFIVNLNLFFYADDLSGEDINRYRNTPLQGNMIGAMHIYGLYAEIIKIFPLLNKCEYSLEDIDVKNNGSNWGLVEKWQSDNHYAFSLSEIDYTYDMPLPFVDTYLKVLNYSHQPTSTNRIRHNHEYGEDNLYEINGSIKINTYDKERELMERFGDSANAQRHQVLRVEVGLKRRKLSYLVRQDKYPNIEERTLFDFVDIDTGYEMVSKYMHQRCYRGDIYDYQTAVNMVDNNKSIKTNMKTKLKAVLYGVQYHRGVDKFIKNYVEVGGNEETVKSHIKRLEDLGINPVTISRRDKSGFPLPDGGRVLPSIFTMIDKMHAIEKDNKEHPENVFELMGAGGYEIIESDDI